MLLDEAVQTGMVFRLRLILRSALTVVLDARYYF